MKKVLSMIFATSAAAIGLFFAGSAYASASTIVTVKSGDTVWGISQQYNSSVKAIESANNLQDANVITVGQQLTIPSANSSSNTQGSAHVAAATTTAQQTQSYSQPTQSTQSTQATTQSSQASTTTATSGSVAQQAAQLMEQRLVFQHQLGWLSVTVNQETTQLHKTLAQLLMVCTNHFTLQVMTGANK